MKHPFLILGILALFLAGCNNETPDESSPPSPEAAGSRHVLMDGQSNFRDIGGYRTRDGKTVKWGMIYRSGELPKLSDADVKKLEDLKIETVVNFLTPSEIQYKGEDKLPEGTNRIYLPIDVDMGQGTSVDGLIQARKTGDFSQVPAEISPGIHRILTKDARAQYAQLFRHIADPDQGPLVFHCSHGVHRTGTAAALILSALGVPWETVREDYLLSNTYRKEEVVHRLEQLKQLDAKNKGISPEEVDTTNMRAFYILESSYIDATLNEAVKEYGSIEQYIRQGLGITEEEITQLRNTLLE